jgi:hypothetical protein
MTRTPDQWHLDRRFAVGLILTLFLQFGGLVWWGAKMDERMIMLEKQVIDLRNRPLAAVNTVSRITGLETAHEIKFVELDRRLESIESKLDKLNGAILAMANDKKPSARWNE